MAAKRALIIELEEEYAWVPVIGVIVSLVPSTHSCLPRVLLTTAFINSGYTSSL